MVAHCSNASRCVARAALGIQHARETVRPARTAGPGMTMVNFGVVVISCGSPAILLGLERAASDAGEGCAVTLSPEW